LDFVKTLKANLRKAVMAVNTHCHVFSCKKDKYQHLSGKVMIRIQAVNQERGTGFIPKLGNNLM